jgi:hypothetical protein
VQHPSQFLEIELRWVGELEMARPTTCAFCCVFLPLSCVFLPLSSDSETICDAIRMSGVMGLMESNMVIHIFKDELAMNVCITLCYSYL